MSPIPFILLAASLPTAKSINVQIIVKVPKNTPPNAKVYVAGNTPALGNWRADGLQLDLDKNGRYKVDFEAAEGEKIEFKFTLGTWDSVEKDANGNDIPNRKITVGQDAFQTGDGYQNYIFRIDRWAAVDAKATTPAKPPNRKSTRTGDIRLHENFESRELANKRSLIVYLPPGYEDPESKDERYPVLYMHDGQNLFDASTSFIGVEWGADETAERLIKAKKIPPIIIVGIYNTPDRRNEYTPTRDEKRGEGGKGDVYADFVVNRVKQFIDKTYRTSPKRRDTAIAGSSLGGLISLHMAVRYPSLFSRVGVISPALFWDEHELIRRIENAPALMRYRESLPPTVPGRALEREKGPVQFPYLWLDMGTKEGDTLPTFNAALEDTRRLAAALKKAGLRENEDYKYVEVEGGLHNETAWAARFEDILLFFWQADAQDYWVTSAEFRNLGPHAPWYKRVRPLSSMAHLEIEIEPMQLGPMSRTEALAFLLSANDFSVGLGGGMFLRLESRAFKVIFDLPDASDVFKELLKRATKEGQLYALCGLWHHDRKQFDQEVTRFKSDETRLLSFRGCFGMERSVKSLIESNSPCVYRLKPGQSLKDWAKENPCKDPDMDIVGGSYTWELIHPE